MEQVITGKVIGARRYDINGDKIASIFLIQEVDESNEDTVGKEVLKISAPYEIVTQLRNHEKALPSEFELKVAMVSGSGGRVSLRCKEIRPLKAPAANPAPQAQK